MPQTLYVLTAITNPVRFQTRYRLFENFRRYIEACDAYGRRDTRIQLVAIECQHGDRPHVVTSSDNRFDLQLRTHHELWHKENLLNIGFSRLPSDWQYAAWIDGDVEFMRDDWAVETIEQLRHYSLVQPWSHAIDLGPHHETIQTHKGFCAGYLNRQESPALHCNWNKNYEYWHTGFAWAIRREAFDKLHNGLIDWAVLGSADHHMAWALVNQVRQSVPANISKRYMDKLVHWQDRVERHIRRNIGYVPGTLMHHWHGKKKDRKYKERWQIITENNFDPDLDLCRDWQGVWQLTNRSIGLRDDLRQYFRSRNEDSTDME